MSLHEKIQERIIVIERQIGSVPLNDIYNRGFHWGELLTLQWVLLELEKEEKMVTTKDGHKVYSPFPKDYIVGPEETNPNIPKNVVADKVSSAPKEKRATELISDLAAEVRKGVHFDCKCDRCEEKRKLLVRSMFWDDEEISSHKGLSREEKQKELEERLEDCILRGGKPRSEHWKYCPQCDKRWRNGMPPVFSLEEIARLMELIMPWWEKEYADYIWKGMISKEDAEKWHIYGSEKLKEMEKDNQIDWVKLFRERPDLVLRIWNERKEVK